MSKTILPLRSATTAPGSQSFALGPLPLALCSLLFALSPSLSAAEPTKAQLDFFENRIRPTLANHCYKCHSAAEGKRRGGLVVDTREGLLTGGDSGPAIVPGDPEKSLLIKAIRYTDPDMQMPPKGEKLSDSQIADLTNWVKMGGPDPRTGALAGGKDYAKGGSDHWAFQPVRKPMIPAVSQRDWVANPIDAFILSKQEQKGLKPSNPADKRTLIRRATFDLIGLPPTPDEVQAFLDDKSPDAFAKVVDRLLDSKHYSERWGRYWLDVARYSDTKGDVNNRREGPLYPYAWTYRDYVIDSFNQDKPYNQFLIEQIAADKLPLGQDKSALAALGFITLGNRFDGNNNEIINDRIDTLTKTTLALTVACARCHDHMFDPIPTKDYYALHGIFSSSIEPEDKPLIEQTSNSPEYQDYVKQRAAVEAEIQSFIDKSVGNILSDFRTKAGAYILANRAQGSERAAIQKNNKLSPDTVRIWQRVLAANGRRKTDPIFGPYHTFAAIPENEFAQKARAAAAAIVANKDPKNPINPIVANAFRTPPASMSDVVARYGQIFAYAEQQWQATLTAYEKRKATVSKPGPAPARLNDANLEIVRQVPMTYGMPRNIDQAEAVRRLMPQNLQRRLTSLEEKLAKLEIDHPGAPARAMALLDSPNPRDSKVFIRGEPGNQGDVVPRRFLEVLSKGSPQPFKNGSGRLELAQAIATKDNPLTARVMVNRVWMHHFGEGFVPTPDDFGTMAEKPSHPELLDYLAAWFMDNGWSLKKLHREIMLSNTYQQSSEDNPRFAQIDPDNRLLWRANIRKLEFEALRDSLLYIGGKLDLTVGGKPVNLSGRSGESYRRTIYGLVDRSNLPEVFNHFDFANPDIATGKRYETIVPQQSLFLMNSPIVMEQARNVVQRPKFKELSDDDARIKWLYEVIYQRPPTADEIKLGQSFIAGTPANQRMPAPATPPPAVAAKQQKGKTAPAGNTPSNANRPLSGWEQYVHALLLTNEMSFVN